MKIPADVYLALDIASTAYRLDINLFGALAYGESGFNPQAIAGNRYTVQELLDIYARDGQQGLWDANVAIGLVQLHTRGAGASLTLDQLLDPYVNARTGARYFRACLDVTPTPEDAISAYNQGIGGWQQNGILDEQRGWIAAVIATWRRFQAEGLQPDDDRPAGPQPPPPLGTITIDIPPGAERAIITFLGAIL